MPDNIAGRDAGWGIVIRLVAMMLDASIDPPITYLRATTEGTVSLVAACDADDAPQTFTLNTRAWPSTRTGAILDP